MAGATVSKWVRLAADSNDAASSMRESGAGYQAQSSGFGEAVCQVNNEPTSFPKCFPPDQPYWSLFVEIGGAWASAPNGYATVNLHDKEALGWHYVQQTDPSPAPPPLATTG